MTSATHCFEVDTPAPMMLHDEIIDKRAWQRDHVSPSDWLIPFPEAGVAELDEAVAILDQYPQPNHHLTLDQLPSLMTCRQVMTQVRTTLYQSGMAVIDQLPVDRYSTEQNKAIYRLLGQMLGRVVDQKWGDTTLYDVKDSGKALGHGVRRSITNLGQPFHTDGPWLSMTPEIVSLFCLQTAQTGGMSRLVSPSPPTTRCVSDTPNSLSVCTNPLSGIDKLSTVRMMTPIARNRCLPTTANSSMFATMTTIFTKATP